MWFWFFEARKAATTAPLALWLNGGPGCSSMIGLFQEHGPCTFNSGGSKPVLNPYSWNNFANMVRNFRYYVYFDFFWRPLILAHSYTSISPLAQASVTVIVP